MELPQVGCDRPGREARDDGWVPPGGSSPEWRGARPSRDPPVIQRTGSGMIMDDMDDEHAHGEKKKIYIYIYKWFWENGKTIMIHSTFIYVRLRTYFCWWILALFILQVSGRMSNEVAI